MYGNAIGDALGSPLEFSAVRYDLEEHEVTGFDDTSVWTSPGRNRFSLRPGQFTDDFSMGLCMADSLVVCGRFDPIDMRTRFGRWWNAGYNTAFGFSPFAQDRIRRAVGLGGNIGASLTEFKENGSMYTEAGNYATSGNGSIMRMAPISVFYSRSHDNADDADALHLGRAVAYGQSKTTHKGDEAADCARLLAHICISAINRESWEDTTFAEWIDGSDVLASFPAYTYSVQCMAASQNEEPHPSNANLELADRVWNWKDPEYRYCPRRAKSQPGYIGSYAMDALAMALHAVYTTDSFSSAVLKVINYRGDADSVGAVAGQIAGAFYGVDSVPDEWISAVETYARDGDIGLKSALLLLVPHSPNPDEPPPSSPSERQAPTAPTAPDAGDGAE